MPDILPWIEAPQVGDLRLHKGVVYRCAHAGWAAIAPDHENGALGWVDVEKERVEKEAQDKRDAELAKALADAAAAAKAAEAPAEAPVLPNP